MAIDYIPINNEESILENGNFNMDKMDNGHWKLTINIEQQTVDNDHWRFDISQWVIKYHNIGEWTE